MESDSTLPALSLVISVLFFGLSELGAAAIVARAQSFAVASVLNGSNPERDPLSILDDLPAGPTASLRVFSFLAFTAAIISVAALVVSVWGVRWELVSIGVVLGLLSFGALMLTARWVGYRYSDFLAQVAPRAAWLLSFPLRPILSAHSSVINSASSDTSNRADAYLDLALSADSEEPPLDEHEVKMIRGVVQLDQTVAREIMVPRVDIVAVEAGDPLEDVAEKMNVEAHSRVPVYTEDLDHVTGVAYARDILQQLSNGADPSVMTAGQVSRDPLFIPESKNLVELLQEFQEQRIHMAIVVDEYGGVSGIVTIEDLLEEIVGEIHDEFDTEEPEIQRVNDTEYLVDAGLPTDELNEVLGVNVVGDGFDTVGGFVFDQLGKIPVAGDTVRYDGIEIVVVSTIGRRPKTLRVYRRSAETLVDSKDLPSKT